MASDLPLNSNFTWGDGVTVVPTAPIKYRPGENGWICSIRKIGTQQLADRFNVQICSELYLIEYLDGSDQEIPGCFLTKYED